MKNLNLIFNKMYYEKLGQDSFKDDVIRYNEMLFSTTFDHKTDYEKLPTATNSFLLETTYPGLLAGTGNPHGTRQSTDDINLGFSFDYVTGQPYIPGSSVKGVLRSTFKKKEAICEILKAVTGCDCTIQEAENLEKEIFDGADVFFDAVIYDGDENGRIIGSDYITPHPELTKNPIPIFMLKVLPGVRFEFRFKINGEKLGGRLDEQAEADLFKELLQIFGIGARTNVGYGNLKACDDAIKPKTALMQTNRLENNRPTNRAASGEITRKICKKCGKPNYKYNKNNPTTVNWNWEKNICWDKNCRGELE